MKFSTLLSASLTQFDFVKLFAHKSRIIQQYSCLLTKKESTHAAAKAMLNKIKGLDDEDSERMSLSFSEEATEAARMLLTTNGLDDKTVMDHVCKTLDIPWRQSHVTMADQEKEIIEIDFSYTYINIAAPNTVFSKTKEYLNTLLDDYSSDE
ncbi:hypothetical protein DMENIID0001_155580 [Sergentomyia squamirostris]